MSRSAPQPAIADDRESGAVCVHCQIEILRGDEMVTCPDCGTVQHWRCWQEEGGCGSYDCAPPRRSSPMAGATALRITGDELDRAVPLPSSPQYRGHLAVASSPAAKDGPASELVTNRLAVASLVVAIAGIPLFGLVTGLVAIVLGSVALGSIHKSRQHGAGLALCGVLLGTADVVGWIVFLSLVWPQPAAPLRLADFEADFPGMENLPPHINRAMRANVFIEARQGRGLMGGIGAGSGVILKVENGSAVIVTNRHVIDSDFQDEEPFAAKPGGSDRLRVKLVGQTPQPGRLLWVAPDGIDLALLSVPVVSEEVRAARWARHPELIVGADVFAIGNPHGLGWTHTQGSISQLRSQRKGAHRVRVIQTNTAINPGNSGGGLYDESGLLIGINTWTNDKRFSEGLSFAIAFESLASLAPPHLPDPGPAEEDTDQP